MTLLNVSLCLPELDVAALQEKHSIVAVTQRFMVPGKSFVLLPCRAGTAADRYQPAWLERLSALNMPTAGQLQATHWAECVFCQQLTEESAIATIAAQTIWTEEALFSQLRSPDSLFLSFLKAYSLSEPIKVEAEPVCDQLYKFLPLLSYLNGNTDQPVLNDEEFAEAKQAILNPAQPSQSEDESKPEDEPKIEDVLDSPDWISKISEVGNSSDGHTFEKLVRKGLIELGFSNTLDRPEASLDPEATGGAGGIDFYADQPYSLVGECKATETEKVQGDPATQLHKLGLKYLSKDTYERSTKLVVAAGKITSHAEKIARGHEISVIRPETLQSLILLKAKYSDSIELSDLKVYLQAPPFGMDADAKILDLIKRWELEFKRKDQYIQQRSQIVATLKELSAQPIHGTKTSFVSLEIRAHHNAKYSPPITDEATQSILTELASPLLGYLGNKQLPGDQERFYFLKDMPEALS